MNTLGNAGQLFIRGLGLIILGLSGFLGLAQAETPYTDVIYEDYYSYTLPKAVYTREESLSLLEQTIVHYYRTHYFFDESVSDEDILQYAALSFEAHLVNVSSSYPYYPGYYDPVHTDCVEHPENDTCQWGY
ncbi:MAG: hypothetical protein KC422_02575 [Trueperaceae bacterium]|nr:hypothetical protein [Trueperaceae bacterium]